MATDTTVRGWGKRIRQAREQRGLDLSEGAAIIGVTRQTLASWETENTSPDLADLPDLAKALDCRLPWLVFGRGEPR